MNVRSLVPKGGTLSDDAWRARHRGILLVLWAHIPALFLFALARGYGWGHGFVDATIVATPAMFSLLTLRHRRLSTIWASVGLMTASAVLVHLSGGVIEAHFHFFVMVGVVVLYQEWIPYLIAIAFVVLHHTVMGSLYPHQVYDHPAAWRHPITWAVIHGVAILAMSAAGIANWRTNEKHQSQLAELNAMLGATLESTADGILVVAPDGHIASMNRRFIEMYQLPASIIEQGQDSAAIAYVIDQLAEPEVFVNRINELYAHPEAESHDTIVFKDGRVMERSSKPQLVAGSIVGRVWTFHDVTNRKRLEDELAEALRMALESSRLKSDFMATMSHEIRTPLNGVVGLTGLLLEMDLDHAQREYVEGVRVSGDALLRIVNDILDFSKIEAGKLEFEVADFDVVQALDDVVTLHAEVAKRNHVSLISECHDCAPRRLRGDVGRLCQIVLNLVANAVKFTESGSVTLRCSTVERAGGSSEAQDKVMLHVEVEDTGIGIAERDLDRLFEPFTQVDASTTRRYGGTGLGLAICKRLATEMGGTVGAASRVGIGSVFVVDIPFARASVSESPQKDGGLDATTPAPSITAPGQGAPRGGCLLIVEDNVVNQLVVKAMVGKLGYRCDIAANGVEALEALRLRRYSAVVMDCYMPEMDGFVATTELRRREGTTSHTPVIALTAGAMASDRDRCAAAGMDDYLTKPIDATQLASVLNRWATVPA